jgi:magnesium transporter
MIRAFKSDNGRLTAADLDGGAPPLWLDMFNPTQAELDAVTEDLGVEMPTRADMEEIETSSRLYLENGVAFLTAILPEGADSDDPQLSPVTFVVAPARLVTIRHHEPRPFATFPSRAQKAPAPCVNSEGVLLGLLDSITDRLADVLERAKREIDDLSRAIFRRSERPQGKSESFQQTLELIGRKGDLVSKIRESLGSMQRLIGFLNQVTLQRKTEKDVRNVIKTLARDIHSLIEYTTFLSDKITLLLDATMGMINIEQSGIIKIFSVASVVFLPPTLIASIYGMNFTDMPELEWDLGYPAAIILMIVAAVLPYQYFKRRGWL